MIYEALGKIKKPPHPSGTVGNLKRLLNTCHLNDDAVIVPIIDPKLFKKILNEEGTSYDPELIPLCFVDISKERLDFMFGNSNGVDHLA